MFLVPTIHIEFMIAKKEYLMLIIISVVLNKPIIKIFYTKSNSKKKDNIK